MAAQAPKKRPDSPEEIGDPEKGLSTFTPKESAIEVVVHKPIAEMPSKKELSGHEILAKAIGPGTYGRGKKKTRKQKKRAHKKTQKRRGRK